MYIFYTLKIFFQPSKSFVSSCSTHLAVQFFLSTLGHVGLTPMSDQEAGSRTWLTDGAMHSKSKGRYIGVHGLVQYTLYFLALSPERA